MKKKLNYRYFLLALIALSFLISACSRNDAPAAPAAPVITFLSPEKGTAGTEVTITGENFGNKTGEVNTTFGSSSAMIISASATQIRVKAPAGVNGTNVNVSVSVNGKTSNSKAFTYKDVTPSITRLSPESGTPGSVITITGTQFGTDPSKVKVRFNNTDATNIISVTDTEIKAAAPAGFSDQAVTVSVLISDLASNTTTFYYADNTPPVITSVPSTCFYNATVIISGNNFSTRAEDNIVRFGTVQATVTAASKTALTVTAPNLGAATSADVTVSKLGMVSNAKTIDVEIDQNKIATYNSWTTHIVKPGVTYKTAQLPLFSASQRRIHILDVTLNDANTLGIGVALPNKTTVAICNDYNAVAGVNAGYFPIAGATADKDPYIRINGTAIQSGHAVVSEIYSNSALLIHNNVATVRKFTQGGNNLNAVAAAIPVSEAQNIIVCGPMLITSGVIENLNMSQSHNSSLTGRTGLGVTADGKRVFLVVADYNGDVTGVSTLQLAKILQALGAVNAMNFDGGGSSTMFVKDQGADGRVSTNTNSQRLVRSVVYVK